jgi:hypothetical protein
LNLPAMALVQNAKEKTVIMQIDMKNFFITNNLFINGIPSVYLGLYVCSERKASILLILEQTI